MEIERITGWLADRTRLTANEPPAGLGRWLDRYQGATFEQVFAPDSMDNAVRDECATLSQRAALSLALPSPRESRDSLFQELRLLYGVGEHYVSALREQGYTSIHDLCSHPRWGEAAQVLIRTWGESPEPGIVYETLRAWLPASHPLFLSLLGLVRREKLLLFDVETLGLANAPIFLAALGRFEGDDLVTTQHICTSLAGEISLLERVGRQFSEATALISYNGKSFDGPLLRERAAYYGLVIPEVPIHVDLLHHARRRLRVGLPDHHLGTIEEAVLGVHREDDLPSAAVPAYYSAYIESRNPGPLVPIIRHNHQDTVTLGLLLQTLVASPDDSP